MPPYSLAIFDFDGTLADSWQLMARAIRESADELGYRCVSAEDAERLRGQDNRAIMAAMDVKMWQLPRIVVHMRRVALEHAAEIDLFPGIDTMLRQLAPAGVDVAVVSSNGEDAIRAVLGSELSNLVTHFDCGATLFGKAAKFRRVVKRAGVDRSRAVGVGDEVRDIDAAAAAGIAAAAVTWGYATREILEARTPTHVVTSVGDLGDLLIGV